MKLPLEDNFEDILSKAQRGLGVGTERLAERTGLAEATLRALRRGELDEAALVVAAVELGLRPEPLLRIARREWTPGLVPYVDGLSVVTTPFGEGSVNAFLVWEPSSKRALAFDTGTDARPMFDYISENGLAFEGLVLTHDHRDHVAGVTDFQRAYPDCPIYIGAGERIGHARTTPIRPGFALSIGDVSIEAIPTPGHAADAYSFRIRGLDREIAIVGDALFAGSMGGAFVDYAQSLDSVARVLSLPESTIIAPGHGPLTTVADELAMNCFLRR